MMMHKRNPGKKGKVHVLEREMQSVHSKLHLAEQEEKEEHQWPWQSMQGVC